MPYAGGDTNCTSHWQNYSFDLKMDTEIDAATAIRGTKNTALLLQKAFHTKPIFFTQNPPSNQSLYFVISVIT